MLHRSCHFLFSRLPQLQLVPSGALATASASRPVSKRHQKRSKKSKLINEIREEQENNPEYLEELKDTKHLMALTESRTPIGAAMRSRLRAEHRSAVRRRVAAAKAAKLRPLELSLLTWAAKKQMFELATNEPQLWTPEALAEVFPVSVEQARCLVKNARRGRGMLFDPASIYRHDRAVLDRLRELQAVRKQQEGQVKAEHVQPGFEWLIRSDKWRLLPHAAGNPVLPLLQKHVIEDALEKEARREVGPFEALLKIGESNRSNRQSRLQAFIEMCEKQKDQVSDTVHSFAAEEPKEETDAVESPSRPSPAPQRPTSLPGQQQTMFAAAVAAPKPLVEEEVKAEAKKPLDTSFGELVDRLEVSSEGLPKSSSKLSQVRPPLRYRSRVDMERVRIFRYSFSLDED